MSEFTSVQSYRCISDLEWKKNVEKTRNLKMLRDRNGHGTVKFNIYYLLDPTSSPNFVRIRDDH